MTSCPIHDPRILEALEACRPGSDDLQDPAMEPLARQIGVFPELGMLYDRLQRTDRAVAEAFQRVHVPAGLAARILTRLAAGPDPLGQLLSMPCTSAEMPALREGMPAKVAVCRTRRRGWLWAAGALAVAASVLVAVVLNFPNSAKLPGVEEVLNQAIAFFDHDARTGGTFLDSEPPPPARYPLSAALPVRNCEVRWRPIDGFLDARGMAYDVTGPGGVSATLYVVKLGLPGVGSSPPVVPMLATGHRSTAVWQEGDLLYVLVVEGDSREYEQFFRQLSSGPVT
jgi:hypothetical protein